MARVTALSIALLLALFEIGSCIRCRQCNSQNDPGCADPFKSTKPSVDCQSQDSLNYNREYLRALLPTDVITHLGTPVPRYCHKIITESGTVIRSCLDSNSIDVNTTCRLLDSSTSIRKIKHCSVCITDDCNGANAFGVSVPLLVALVASYLYFK